MENLIQDLTQFRRELHRNPELSGKEENTAQRILDFLGDVKPTELYINIGGHGLILVFDSGKPGKSILIRGDIDALPIDEPQNLPYSSLSPGVSHKCGHDGHTTILAGLAIVLNEKPLQCGKAILLFQPAEETGMGAEAMLNDWSESIQPEFVFALHNIPGKPKHSIIMKNDWFASASQGMIIKLKGVSAHAGEPEMGINPAFAIARIIKFIKDLPLKKHQKATIIHLKVGEIAFGTSPGEGVIMLTLRAGNNKDMDSLTNHVEKEILTITESESIKTEISFTEVFPATKSHKTANAAIAEAAESLDLKVITGREPFSWSEDFGHFTMRYPGAMFGLGAGEDCPNLHNPDYNFPDELTKTGILMFENILRGMV
jgi:amidohydrolase